MPGGNKRSHVFKQLTLYLQQVTLDLHVVFLQALELVKTVAEIWAKT